MPKDEKNNKLAQLNKELQQAMAAKDHDLVFVIASEIDWIRNEKNIKSNGNKENLK